MSQETRNAQRVVPWALIGSLAVCTVLYILVALMVTGLADYRELGVADPVYVALVAAGPALAWAKPLIGAVVVVGLISALMASLPRDTWIRLAIWLLIGAGLYAAYGIKHSSLRGLNRRARGAS